MSKITDYAFLFQNSSGKSAFNPIGSFQLSQLNSSAVQSQLKAAGINTNSKQYKTVISKMMQNANGMMYTNPAAIKNLMKNYDKDGDYISPATGLAGMDATDIPISQRHVIIDIPEKTDRKCLIMQNGSSLKKMELQTEILQNVQMCFTIIKSLQRSGTD